MKTMKAVVLSILPLAVVSFSTLITFDVGETHTYLLFCVIHHYSTIMYIINNLIHLHIPNLIFKMVHWFHLLQDGRKVRTGVVLYMQPS